MSVREMVRYLDYHVPQLELSWLGGVKTILGRLTFYRGILTFLMLIPVAYNSSPRLQSVFPTIWGFFLALAVLLGIAAIAEYSVIFPSQLKFNKSQAARNGRDPIYQQNQEILNEMDRLQQRIDELEDD